MMSVQFVPYYEKSYTDGFFDVSPSHGFLPIADPLRVLPERYSELQKLIDDLSIHIVYEGQGGILSRANEIETRVDTLPNYAEQVALEDDVFDIQALYRALTFVMSAYTLELSYQEFMKSGRYGAARRFLPAQVSRPLVIVSEKLNANPFLDHFYAYSLGNYVKQDPNGSLHWRNLQMACKFSGTPDETNGSMTHVYVNELSPALLSTVFNIGKGIDLKDNLRKAGETMKQITQRRKEIRCGPYKPKRISQVFLIESKRQDKVFGSGVVYDTCFNNEPQQFYGEQNQDTIMQCVAILTGIVDFHSPVYLNNFLSNLKEIYSPKCFQNFFVDLRAYFAANPLFKTLKDAQRWEELVYLLKLVDEVYAYLYESVQGIKDRIALKPDMRAPFRGGAFIEQAIGHMKVTLDCEQAILTELEHHKAAIYRLFDLSIKILYSGLKETYASKLSFVVDTQNFKQKEFEIKANLIKWKAKIEDATNESSNRKLAAVIQDQIENQRETLDECQFNVIDMMVTLNDYIKTFNKLQSQQSIKYKQIKQQKRKITKVVAIVSISTQLDCESSSIPKTSIVKFAPECKQYDGCSIAMNISIDYHDNVNDNNKLT